MANEFTPAVENQQPQPDNEWIKSLPTGIGLFAVLGKIDKNWTNDKIDISNHTPIDLIGYVLQHLFLYGKKGYRDSDLWEQFRDDFNGWNLQMWRDIYKLVRLDFRDHLRRNGVYIPRNGDIVKDLYDTLVQPLETPWPDSEITYQRDKGGKNNNYFPETPNFNSERNRLSSEPPAESRLQPQQSSEPQVQPPERQQPQVQPLERQPPRVQSHYSIQPPFTQPHVQSQYQPSLQLQSQYQPSLQPQPQYQPSLQPQYSIQPPFTQPQVQSQYQPSLQLQSQYQPSLQLQPQYQPSLQPQYSIQTPFVQPQASQRLVQYDDDDNRSWSSNEQEQQETSKSYADFSYEVNNNEDTDESQSECELEYEDYNNDSYSDGYSGYSDDDLYLEE